MQDLHGYGSSDDSGSLSDSIPAPDQILPRKRRVANVCKGETSAAEWASAVHGSDPDGVSSNRVLSTGQRDQVSLSPACPRQQALPAPSALLDLPVEALVSVPKSCHEHIEMQLLAMQMALPGLELFEHSTNQDQFQYHLSFSHTVPIRYHQIDKLLSSLKLVLQPQQSFQVAFHGWRIYQNLDKTRTFLAVPIIQGVQEVKTAIEYVNESFKAQSLPTFYQEPDPHISVAWMLGDSRLAMEQAVKAHPFAAQEWQQNIITISCIVGQRNTIVWSHA